MTTPRRPDDPEQAVRYLADKLSDAECAAFEEHYLADPTVVEEMELDAKLKAGLIAVRDSNELDRLTSSRRPWATVPIAMAASVLVAVVGFLAFRYGAPEVVLASSTAALSRPLGSPLAVGPTRQLMQTRDVSGNESVPLPRSAQAIELQMLIDIDPPIPPLAITMTAVTEDGSRTDLAVVHQLLPDENGVVTLYVNSAAVAPGTYELSVAREGAPAEPAENVFVLEIAPSTGP